MKERWNVGNGCVRGRVFEESFPETETFGGFLKKHILKLKPFVVGFF
jgi:hypothetical protein